MWAAGGHRTCGLDEQAVVQDQVRADLPGGPAFRCRGRGGAVRQLGHGSLVGEEILAAGERIGHTPQTRTCVVGQPVAAVPRDTMTLVAVHTSSSLVVWISVIIVISSFAPASRMSVTVVVATSTSPGRIGRWWT